MPLRIAVAEDDDANRTTLVRLLEALGHTIPIAVADGYDLVHCCKTTEVDLVFSDFHLPHLDGLAAAEFLADLGIPVVIISGHADAENIVVDHEPIEMVLRKPATIDDLREAIHHVTSGDWQQKKDEMLGS